MVRLVSRNSVLIALLLLILFGALRYQNFLSVFNVLTVLRYNSMFALVALGMCFVIMSAESIFRLEPVLLWAALFPRCSAHMAYGLGW